MMRMFGKTQEFRQKCFICGCKNKVHTDLLNSANEFVGYRLKCCGCGNVEQFMLNPEDNGVNSSYKNEFNLHKGDEYCLRVNFCPRKDCKLRDKHPENKNKLSHKQHSNDEENVKIEVSHKPNFL